MNARAIASLLTLAGLAACTSGKVSSGPRIPDAGTSGPPDASTPDGGETGTGTTSMGGVPGNDRGPPRVSRSLALSASGASLWVVNTESDSISEIDLSARRLAREIALAAHPPAVDPTTHRYDPAVRPRALELVESLGKVYVAGQSANAILVLDLASGQRRATIATGAEPTAIVAAADGSAVYVVNHQSATVQKIDPHTDQVVATATVGEHPWGAALRADGRTLYVSHLLRNPGVTALDAGTLKVLAFSALPDQPPDESHNKLIPNGQARGAYGAIPRPGADQGLGGAPGAVSGAPGELWVPHLLLATATPQPELDFQSTVFPTVTVFRPGASPPGRRLLFRPPTVLTATGAFSDVISGPRDIAFTPDGRFALVAAAQSEDVMVFDADRGVEVGLVRPTPAAMAEGILVDPTGAHAYLHGRASHNVTVLAIARDAGTGVLRDDPGITVDVDGDPIETLASDPMPADLRRGMRLFYSANSAQFPITQNFWVACATCHLEGQTDAVTWRFAQGPRDTPSNAGGPINTGFLFRQAVRNDVTDYDETIRVEQGGSYRRTIAAQLPDLKAIAAFTNFAIPFPQNPHAAPGGALSLAAARGKALFDSFCATCHSGPYMTDSGNGNPSLSMSGFVQLHDVGTCVTSGDFPDQTSHDIEGNPRTACDFDTPTLRGIFATAPYFHDGSAATLDEVIARLPVSKSLGAADRSDLVEYLKTL